MNTRLSQYSPDGSARPSSSLARAIVLVVAAGLLAVFGLTAQPPEPTRASPSSYSLVKLYNNPAPAPFEEFGNAVAWLPSGNEIVVAARSQTVTVDTTGQLGAVYVLSTTTGAVDHVLTRGGPTASDYLGFSLAVSGTQILAGAPHDNNGSFRAGAAYLFDSLTGGVLMTFTDPTTTEANDAFGSSVAVLSDTAIAVGEPSYDVSFATTDVGRVEICLIADGTCPIGIDKPPPINTGGTQFGYSLVALGDKFAVGAPNDGANGTVYVYTTTTAELFTTTAPITSASGARFGSSLAAVNGKLLIGAPDETSGEGGAYLYQPDGTLLKAFHSPTPNSGDFFGTSVASDGTFILIGAPGAAGGDGRAYLYLPDGTLKGTFQENGAGAQDSFGSSVAVLGENFVVGAPGDGPCTQGGSAYRFGTPSSPPANFGGSRKTVNATAARPGDLITYTLTLSNSGPVAASFTLTDALDARLSLVSAPGLTGTSTLAATGVLSGQTQLSYFVTARTSQPFNGSVTNVAHLCGDGFARNLNAPPVKAINVSWLPLVQRH